MRDYTASVTDEQRQQMQDIVKPYTRSMEVRSNNLRDWYNKGQEMFRFFGVTGAATPDDYEFDNELHREGFLMGWNSDAYAWSKGMRLSVLGTTRIEAEDLINAE